MGQGKVRAQDRSLEAAALVDNFGTTLKLVSERKATQAQIDAWRIDDSNYADTDDSDGIDEVMMAMDIDGIQCAHGHAAVVQAEASGGAQLGTAPDRSVARYHPVPAPQRFNLDLRSQLPTVPVQQLSLRRCRTWRGSAL